MEDDSTPALAPDVVMSSARTLSVKKGQAVFGPGSPGDAAYLVVAGKVKISQHTSAGPSNVLASWGLERSSASCPCSTATPRRLRRTR